MAQPRGYCEVVPRPAPLSILLRRLGDYRVQSNGALGSADGGMKFCLAEKPLVIAPMIFPLKEYLPTVALTILYGEATALRFCLLTLCMAKILLGTLKGHYVCNFW